MKVPALLLTTALFLSLFFTGTASASASYYGQSAKSVASKIHCKDFHATGSGLYNMDAGICHLKGRRVNVITFRSAYKLASWTLMADYLGSDFYWASGKGAVVVAKNGSYKTAIFGSIALPGKVRHGS